MFSAFSYAFLMNFLTTIAGLFSFLKFLFALGYQLGFVGSLHFSFYRVEKYLFCFVVEHDEKSLKKDAKRIEKS